MTYEQDTAGGCDRDRPCPETAVDCHLDRRRFALNVLSNWGGHFLLLVTGFVMPRMIDDRIGADRLGIWDFGWSIVGYLHMLTFGITASVNRYVAMHRAQRRMDALNAAVSACWVIFIGTGLAALVIAACVAASLPVFFSTSLAEYMREARWVVILLGASAALEMPLSVYTGVITGMQRYGLMNLIRSGCYLLAVVGMVVALLLGASLTTMASIMLASTILSGCLNGIAAHRVCDGLSISPRWVSRASLCDVVSFGGKTFLLQSSRLFLYQSTNMLIMYALGPSALAYYARPVSLITHARKVLQEFARVVTPTASQLFAGGQTAMLVKLLNKVGQYSFAIAMPIVLFLAIMGGPLLEIWMGKDYSKGAVIVILALGHLASLSQQGTVCLLSGLNAHGRAALFLTLWAAGGCAATALSLCVFGWGLEGAALSIGLVNTIGYGLTIPRIATRRLGQTVRSYFFNSIRIPALANIPFLVVLVVARYTQGHHALISLALGAGAGGACLAVSYWYLLLPRAMKDEILFRLGRIKRPVGKVAGSADR